MKVVQVSSEADSEGVVRLAIPHCQRDTNYELVVVMRAIPKTATDDRGLPVGYVEKTYGSIDDETFVAPPRPQPMPLEPVG
jgi:hypothetical protein